MDAGRRRVTFLNALGDDGAVGFVVGDPRRLSTRLEPEGYWGTLGSRDSGVTGPRSLKERERSDALPGCAHVPSLGSSHWGRLDTVGREFKLQL